MIGNELPISFTSSLIQLISFLIHWKERLNRITLSEADGRKVP